MIKTNKLKMVAENNGKFDYGTASEMLGVFDGSPERVDQFTDTLDVLCEVIPEEHHGLLLKLVKTRLIGKARYVCSAASKLEEIKEALETHCAPVVSSRLALAKLNSINQIGDALSFAEKIEACRDKLLEQYVAENMPYTVASKMADEASIDALTYGARRLQTRFILRAGTFKNLTEAITKFLKVDSTPDEFKQIFRKQQRGKYFTRNRKYQHNETAIQKIVHPQSTPKTMTHDHPTFIPTTTSHQCDLSTPFPDIHPFAIENESKEQSSTYRKPPNVCSSENSFLQQE